MPYFIVNRGAMMILVRFEMALYYVAKFRFRSHSVMDSYRKTSVSRTVNSFIEMEAFADMANAFSSMLVEGG